MPSRNRRIRAALWLLLAPLLMGKFQGDVPGCSGCGVPRAALEPIGRVIPRTAWSESDGADLDVPLLPGGGEARGVVRVTVDQDPSAWQPLPVEIELRARLPVMGARWAKGCCSKGGARNCIVVDAGGMNGFAGLEVRDAAGATIAVPWSCSGVSHLCREGDPRSCTGAETRLARSLTAPEAVCDRQSGRCTIDLVLVLRPSQPPPDGYQVVFVEEGTSVRSVPYQEGSPLPVHVGASATIRGPKVAREELSRHPKPPGLKLTVEASAAAR